MLAGRHGAFCRWLARISHQHPGSWRNLQPAWRRSGATGVAVAPPGAKSKPGRAKNRQNRGRRTAKTGCRIQKWRHWSKIADHIMQLPRSRSPVGEIFGLARGVCPFVVGYPMLTRSAIEAIELRGSEVLKQHDLPKLASGEWTGMMNLTEPQAGSDLAAICTRTVQQDDGTYRIFGQKIFITYGEHDIADNIIHLVLARARCSRRRKRHLAVRRIQVPA